MDEVVDKVDEVVDKMVEVVDKMDEVVDKMDEVVDKMEEVVVDTVVAVESSDLVFFVNEAEVKFLMMQDFHSHILLLLDQQCQ